MTTSFASRRRVLFVDDEPAFLDMIQRVMGAMSQGRWEILLAENASRALSLIQEQPIHLVVIDVQMPVIDGLQFLTLLNRRFPNLQKVVLTGFATEAYRTACLSNGAELFLEKPKSREGQESLYAALNELLKWQPEEGFRGVLRRVGLQDVIQMECLAASSSVLEIKTPRSQGRIFIRQGTLVHAEAGELQGVDAFNHLLAFRGGEFWLKPFAEPPSRTLEGPWEFLLMEAARMRDEIMGQAGQEGVPASEEATSGLVLPVTPLEAIEVPPALEEPSTSAATETADATPGLEPAEVGVAGGRQIEEFLICAGDGTVLCDWQCRSTDLWINFFEFLSQKSRRMAAGLPLGRLERVEATDGEHRLVAILRDNQGILVRTRHVAGAEVEPPPVPA